MILKPSHRILYYLISIIHSSKLNVTLLGTLHDFSALLRKTEI